MVVSKKLNKILKRRTFIKAMEYWLEHVNLKETRGINFFSYNGGPLMTKDKVIKILKAIHNN